MKRTANHHISVRTKTGVNFLAIPKQNVVDLRRVREETVAPPPVSTKQRVSRGAGRKTVKFLLLALVVALPAAGVGLWQHVQSLEGKVLGASTEGIENLRSAANAIGNVDTALAEREFTAAATSFREARSTLDGFRFVLNGLTEAIPVVSKLKTGRALTRAGEAVAKAGAELATVAEPFLLPQEERKEDFSYLLTSAQEHLPVVLDQLHTAVDALHDVSLRDLPESLRAPYSDLQNALPTLTIAVNRLQEGSRVLFELLGGKGARRYLVLFQNNLELRATGGFVSGLALVDIASGRVTKLQIPGGGAYDFKGQLTEKIIAPEPLHIVNAHWQLQDANWWPDFPTSAEKIIWFYEKSGGPTVDGIIAVTPDVVVELLKQVGPLDVPVSGKIITADNVVRETLLANEETPDRPQQLIADLVPLIFDRLLNTPSLDQLQLLGVIERAVQAKQLLIHLRTEDMQRAIAALGWGGAVAQAERDALMVVDTNIGGGKTDGVVDVKIDHEARIADDGSITDTVTVTRVHHGVVGDPITGMRNIAFVRFYIPKGSTLVTADGFERIDPKRFQAPEAGYRVDQDIERIEGRPIVDELTQTRVSEEFGYTVFANWIGVGPGETTIARITYRLPFALNIRSSFFRDAHDTYSNLVQKQPGTSGRYFTQTVTFPGSLAATWVSPVGADVQQEQGKLRFSVPLDTDQLVGIAFRKE